ncbi:methyltransferase domain-containing protein [Chloroflexi bacterium TSY]|nr:methyltransferase domain-containing protein [Chloroflexi bacterium TSY]
MSERDIETTGDVKGRSLLHLQCATGEDTLSWSVLGADAVGVDIAAAEIALAKEKAAEAGLSTQFEVADVLNLPENLQAANFDIVYTGGGALVWLPDIEQWARSVSGALRRGGRLVLHEEHPVAWCLESNGGQVKISDDYFQRGRVEESPPGWTHFDSGGRGTEPKYEFVFPLGDIVTALVEAGMRILSLREFPSEHNYRFDEDVTKVARLPGSYLLVAEREK